MIQRTRFNTTSRNRLSDRDMLMDLLTTEKYMSHLYDHAILESSASIVRDTFEEFQHDEHGNARTLLTSMKQRGWYGTEIKPAAAANRNKDPRYSLTANSEYAVIRGAKRFGHRLARRADRPDAMMRSGRMRGKSGIHTDQLGHTDYQSWQ